MSDKNVRERWLLKGHELIKKLEGLGEKTETPVRFEKRRGKGSHGTLFFGSKFTIIPDVKRELKTGTLKGILRALGVRQQDL